MSKDLSNRQVAPCGPECRHATVLPASYGEWVWCTRRRAPHATTGRHGCGSFVARTGLERPDHDRKPEADPLPPVDEVP